MPDRQTDKETFFKLLDITSLGKYLDRVDRVMTQVDRITEDIAHMPTTAFIFKDKENDNVQYSSDIRYPPAD